MIKKIGMVAVAAVATLAASLGVLNGGAATATPKPPVSPPSTEAPDTPDSSGWVSATCATGEFGALTVDGQGHRFLHATTSLCQQYSPILTYTVVVFRPDQPVADAFASSLRPYASSGPTPVDIVFGRVDQPAIGICLMLSPRSRIACVRAAVDVLAIGVP